MERPLPQQILATANSKNNLIYGDNLFISSDKPIKKKRIEQVIKSIKENLEFIFCSSKYSGFIKNTTNKVNIQAIIIASPPILTIGFL